MPVVRAGSFARSAGTCLATLACAYVGFAGEPSLTVEDLIAARERGDLTQTELEELYELVEARAQADVEALRRARSKLLLDEGDESGVDLPARSRQRTWSLSLEVHTLAPLRGSSSVRDFVRVQPSVGALAFAVDVERRAAGTWEVRQAGGSFSEGAFDLQVGALDVEWAGGLLIGRAPGFIEGGAGLWGGFLQPSQARLAGVSGRWRNRLGDVEALVSVRRDDELEHRTTGLRYTLRRGAVSVAPAFVWQRLAVRADRASFPMNHGGVSFEVTRGQPRLRTDLAFSGRNAAIQVQLERRSRDFNWRAAYWRIPVGFRNPLLHAHGESDREAVEYPELDLELSSASTGESGGEVEVRFGPRSSSRVWFTCWREQPFRRASLRAGIGQRVRALGLRWSGSLYHYTRDDEGDRLHRTECALSVDQKHALASLRVRRTPGHWPPFGSTSGQVRIGARSGLASLGFTTVATTFETYDLARGDRFFWTVQIDQRMQVHATQAIELHLRWRSGYGDTPRSLTLRIDWSLAA